jgi:hypothetical protein
VLADGEDSLGLDGGRVSPFPGEASDKVFPECICPQGAQCLRQVHEDCDAMGQGLRWAGHGQMYQDLGAGEGRMPTYRLTSGSDPGTDSRIPSQAARTAGGPHRCECRCQNLRAPTIKENV